MSSAPPELAKALLTAYKTGKVVLGFRRSVKLAMLGKAKAVVVAANAPPEFKADLKRYASLSKIPVITFPGTNVELGTLLGKPFGISAMAIIDPGQSNILELAEVSKE